MMFQTHTTFSRRKQRHCRLGINESQKTTGITCCMGEDTQHRIPREGDKNSEEIGTGQAVLRSQLKRAWWGQGCLRRPRGPAGGQLSALPRVRTGPHVPGDRTVAHKMDILGAPWGSAPWKSYLKCLSRCKIPRILVLEWTLFIKLDPGKHWDQFCYLKNHVVI